MIDPFYSIGSPEKPALSPTLEQNQNS